MLIDVRTALAEVSLEASRRRHAADPQLEKVDRVNIGTSHQVSDIEDGRVELF